MKLKLAGVIFILIGFAAPFAVKKIDPNIMYAGIFTMLCFWIGFLSILNPIKNNDVLNPYLRWARYAILFHIAWFLLISGYVHLMYYYESLQLTGYYTLQFIEFLRNPIGLIFEQIVSRPMTQQPDGSVQITYSFTRFLLTNFFSLIAYSFVGIGLKIIKDRKISSGFIGFGPHSGPHP